MSSSKSQEGMINGPRPKPLRINKDSYVIHKSVEKNPSTKKPPVIIYTQTPKIIHADARDFMSLVQKLTGLDRSEEEKKVKPETKNEAEVKDVKNVGYEERESALVLTEEKYVRDVKLQNSTAVSPMYGVPNFTNYMADVPLFTPNSSEFFCSSRPNNTLFQSSISPNSFMMDYMKGYPEY